MGFVMPSVRILDNVQLDANSLRHQASRRSEAGRARSSPASSWPWIRWAAQVQLPGQHALEPTFGLPATWIDAAPARGGGRSAAIPSSTPRPCSSTHLTEVLKANMAELLSYAEVQKLLKDLPKEHAELVKELVPSQITVTGIQRVLQLLLDERVSIRDLPTILEGIAEAAGFTRKIRATSPSMCARASPASSARSISAPGGHLPIVTLSPQWETAFAESIVGSGEERQLAMQPSQPAANSSSRARTLRGGGAARARCRCSSPRPRPGPSCAPSSNASAARRRC